MWSLIKHDLFQDWEKIYRSGFLHFVQEELLFALMQNLIFDESYKFNVKGSFLIWCLKLLQKLLGKNSLSIPSKISISFKLDGSMHETLWNGERSNQLRIWLIKKGEEALLLQAIVLPGGRSLPRMHIFNDLLVVGLKVRKLWMSLNFSSLFVPGVRVSKLTTYRYFVQRLNSLEKSSW